MNAREDHIDEPPYEHTAREYFLMEQFKARGLSHFAKVTSRRVMSFQEYLVLRDGYAWDDPERRRALIQDAEDLFSNHPRLRAFAHHCGVDARRLAWLYAYTL